MANKNTKHTLISFTCSWGYTKGGINAFNTDFLEAMANAYLDKVHIVCVVLKATETEIQDAADKNITLIDSHYKPESNDTARNVLEKITNRGISLDPTTTIFLGHDRISGEIALLTSKLARGRSALIHHMSYDHYESFAENSESAKSKSNIQESLFKEADIPMAVGPLLSKALEDMIDKSVDMIIPGLAEIEPRTRPLNTFSMFVSGRLDEDSSRNKQGQLALAAFATCCKKAKEQQYPESLINNRPKLLMRGVNFEGNDANESHYSSSEKNLNRFAEKYSDSVINLQALPYTTERNELFNELRKSSLAAMPSWHEGFGLVAWEAIAAGVPLIISKDSGVFQLISKNHPGFDTGFIWAVDIKGKVDEPHFSDKDLAAVDKAIQEVAKKPAIAREKASKLKSELSQYTWPNCAENVINIFGWDLKKGVIDESKLIDASSISKPQERKPAVKVHIETSGLSIPQSNWNPSSGMPASVLLKASEEVVPFDTNRQPDLDKLLNWSKDDSFPLAIRLIKGEGGVGKTRLASELCKQLKNKDWNAGFYKVNEDITLASLWDNCCENKNNNIIVIDYAETRTNDIISLIKLIIQTKSFDKTRLLLLARDGGEWWDNLPAKDTDSEGVLSSSATTGPYSLSALYGSQDERKQGFQTALSEFSKILNVSTPMVNPDLLGPHFDKPLFIQMAALLALHGEQPKSSDGITRAIINHEQRYWAAALINESIELDALLAKKLLALVTLIGDFETAKEAFNYWKIVDDSNISISSFSKLFNCLVRLYPGYKGLQAVKPDLLGEELVSQVLLSTSGDDLLTVVLSKNVPEKYRGHALTLIARLSNYKPSLLPMIEASLAKNLASTMNSIVNVATETPSRLTELATEALKKQPKNSQSSLATQLSSLITSDSLALNALGSEAKRILYEKSKVKAIKKINSRNLKVQSDFLIDIINYAASLISLGKNHDGLSISKEGLEVANLISSDSTEEGQSIYSAHLHCHSISLHNSGYAVVAEKYAKQALEIRKNLTKKNPDRFQPDLALSLSSYSTRLGDLGRYIGAEDYARQALEIRKKIAEKNPDHFQPDLALSLDNYAIMLNHLDKEVEAESYAKQALEIRKKIAEKNPDRFQPDLARSLDNYAIHLGLLGRIIEAEHYAKQALEITRNLAEQNPDRFQPDLASSLGTYANNLSNLGKAVEAECYAKKALEMAKNFADKNQDRFQFDLALLLSIYAHSLNDLSRTVEAEDYAKQALEIQQPLAEKHPEKYSYHFVFAYLNHNLFAWLADQNQEVQELSLENYLNHMPKSKQQNVKLFKTFNDSIRAIDTESKEILFKKILDTYKYFSHSQKVVCEDYFHCSFAWLYNKDLVLEESEKWLERWHKYKLQRDNNVPKWMLLIAKKLEFSFP